MIVKLLKSRVVTSLTRFGKRSGLSCLDSTRVLRGDEHEHQQLSASAVFFMIAALQIESLRGIKFKRSTRCLAPRARLTSHPVCWKAVDRHRSFPWDRHTFASDSSFSLCSLMMEGWSSLFLPEWIHVWPENTTFFKNRMFHTGPRRLQRATRQSAALLDLCFHASQSLTVWEWRHVWHSQKTKETSRGF